MCVIEDSPRIETRRLLADEWDVVRMTGRMPHPYTLADAQQFVARASADDPSRDNTFVIEHEPDGPLGVIGFFKTDEPHTEVGYWVGKPYWNRGFATEALEAAMGWARRRWKKRVVVAGHFSDNPASGQVLAKAGFLYTGEVKHKPSLARGGSAAMRMMVWLA
jgi:RimJ/RimL family protein N-acetyltransferase